MRIMAAVFALIAFSTCVLAQTRVIPRAWMWQDQPVSIPATSQFTTINGIIVNEISQGDYTPAAAADALAQKIHANLSAGNIASDSVCIMIRGFGHDNLYSETTSGPNATHNATRFFCEIDRLPGMTDQQFPSQNSSDVSDRTYRHPFLSNATTTGPLHEWTEDFVAAFEAICDNPNHPYNQNPPLPDPREVSYRVYMDVEAWIAHYGGPNAVYMLSRLYSYGNTAGNPDIWNAWKVPGSSGWAAPSDSEIVNPSTTAGFASTTGQTLAQMYADARAAQAANGVTQWPTILTGSGGLLASQRADIGQNRPFMQWWYHVTKNAEVAVPETSLFSVLRGAGWQVITSNYDAARYDGQIANTGWFVDEGQSNTASDMLPRGWIDRQAAPPVEEEAIMSDVNYDDIVTDGDFNQFMDAFAAEVAAADLDLNGVVDLSDAEIFIDSYVNPTP
ncbi:MAG: hypothetical protein SFY69_12430 [Planctomycetota bacterium]|nr:hypothetical protein [Planctomycetota bacterium]